MFWVPLVVVGMGQARVSRKGPAWTCQVLRPDGIPEVFANDSNNIQGERIHTMG